MCFFSIESEFSSPNWRSTVLRRRCNRLVCVRLVDICTQVERHLYTKQSKFDGADTIQHIQCDRQFWFRAPTHRSLFFVRAPFFLYNFHAQHLISCSFLFRSWLFWCFNILICRNLLIICAHLFGASNQFLIIIEILRWIVSVEKWNIGELSTNCGKTLPRKSDFILEKKEKKPFCKNKKQPELNKSNYKNWCWIKCCKNNMHRCTVWISCT